MCRGGKLIKALDRRHLYLHLCVVPYEIAASEAEELICELSTCNLWSVLPLIWRLGRGRNAICPGTCDLGWHCCFLLHSNSQLLLAPCRSHLIIFSFRKSDSIYCMEELLVLRLLFYFWIPVSALTNPKAPVAQMFTI